MIKTFFDAVKALQEYIPPPGMVGQGEAGFQRMKKLAEMVGNPQGGYPVIHVGGTSGKGSTATMIAAILGKSMRVGLHTSPHLVSPTERMKINGTDIAEQRFVELARIVIPYGEQLALMQWGKPTYFEVLTAMMFLYFQQETVDVAVIEVGLGGTIDATNIVHPTIAVLTNVGLDHTEILGDTVEEIAKDKVGIIKRGIRVVSGVTQPTVQEIIQQRCRDQQASLSLLNKDFHFQSSQITDTGSVFHYNGKKSYKNIQLSLLGEHQVSNAALAIRAVEEFVPEKNGDLEQQVRETLITVSIPGRMEILQKNPMIILDGAHNEDKMRALAQSMQQVFPKKQVVTMLAVKRDKHLAKLLRGVLHISTTLILTGYDLITEGGHAISYTPEELAVQIQALDSRVRVHLYPDVMEAFQFGKHMVEADGILLITGSLYLIGEVKKFSI